ncbi:MAG: biopolymer transporter ExbD [Sinobacteraceae bacterium]|nr:biopolymer transporter ExbD [Nevskiaceae bacterium]
MLQSLSRENRRAKRRARARRQAWVNIVPMVDVLTVLVFFLLINSTGVSILELRLPSATAASQPPAHQLTVTLRADALQIADNGSTIRSLPRLEDGHYDLDALGQLLESIKKQLPKEKNIILLMEPNTSYAALVAVMDTVKAQPAPIGPKMIPLFPNISLGDAPASSHNAASSAPAKPARQGAPS